MPDTQRFFSIHRQGFVRVAACTPLMSVGDPRSNTAETLKLMREGDGRSADLMLFPELGISAYAIDDLLLQDALLDGVEAGLAELAGASRALRPVFILGAPIRRNGRLYNCGVAISRGRILGVVPKSFLPNYREYYENRWFAPGFGVAGLDVKLAGQTVPFGTDLLFAATDLADFIFHVEICEDFWAADPPSTQGALAGALILCNLSASNIVVGKADDRGILSASQSMRCMAAYVYSAAGPGESTTDLAWDGQATIHELGIQLACTERFPEKSQMCVADVDVERLRLERMRTLTFNSAAVAAGHPETAFRRIEFEHQPAFEDVGLERAIDRFPFVPDNAEKLDRDCYEAFNIQVQGLMKRMQVTKGEHIVIGVSGGLDSTHALIVAAKTFDRLGLPRKNILGFTMPGFATSAGTKANAWALMNALGVTGEEIDIKPAALRMLEDLGHPYAQGKPVYDVTFENVQAGLRTDYLFRLANQRKGFVLGTGDLSARPGLVHLRGRRPYESLQRQRLGGKNAHSVSRAMGGEDEAVRPDGLGNFAFDPGNGDFTRLAPANGKEAMQSTQSKVGPYELQDFHLYYITRYGLRPSKVAFLAWHGWRDAARGLWPPDFPEEAKHAYSIAEIKKWLGVFLYRFFEISQYKRSALPNGPKVTSGGNLSPRGDWRAPSDGSAVVWLEELERNVPGNLPTRAARPRARRKTAARKR